MGKLDTCDNRNGTAKRYINLEPKHLTCFAENQWLEDVFPVPAGRFEGDKLVSFRSVSPPEL